MFFERAEQSATDSEPTRLGVDPQPLDLGRVLAAPP